MQKVTFDLISKKGIPKKWLENIKNFKTRGFFLVQFNENGDSMAETTHNLRYGELLIIYYILERKIEEAYRQLTAENPYVM